MAGLASTVSRVVTTGVLASAHRHLRAGAEASARFAASRRSASVISAMGRPSSSINTDVSAAAAP
jgi:hypothetical protein